MIWREGRAMSTRHRLSATACREASRPAKASPRENRSGAAAGDRSVCIVDRQQEWSLSSAAGLSRQWGAWQIDADVFEQPTMTNAKYAPIRVGDLPVDKINKALGVELDAGEVWVSAHAHRHIAQDHPDIYDEIIAAIFEIVTAPLYVGQDPRHGENFYVVRRLPESAARPFGLVAIGFEKGPSGVYNVRTAYGINQDTVDKRRAAKRLHMAL
jgi:hypothetical protein